MPTYFEQLLAQTEPLERHEIADLKAWLAALRDDVATFGDTPEDNRRMATIEARIKRDTPGE